MSKSYRFPVFLVLLAVAAVSLVGCLKPGGNDSSSAPPSILAPDTTNTGLSSYGPNVVFKATNTLFSHDKHVGIFKRNCVDCHKANGVASTPWAMVYKDHAFTMAQIWGYDSTGADTTPNGCGICHKKGGAAFDAREKASCKRCHSSGHKVEPDGIEGYAGYIGSEACVLCHSGIVTEYQTKNPKSTVVASGTMHAANFIVARGGNAATNYACSECHVHESMDGRAKAFQTQLSSDHTITCQTCHFPTTENGGEIHPYRLRKAPEDLCANCHHARNTYGNLVAPTATFDRPDTSAGVPEFPFLYPYSMSATSSWPMEFNGNNVTSASSWNKTANYLDFSLLDTSKPYANRVTRDASMTVFLASFTARYLTPAFTGTNNTAFIRGNAYPHYSPQYDTVKGSLAKTYIAFSKDVNGTTLTPYTDSAYTRDNKACINCHLAREETNIKTNYGHTFQVSEETVLKVTGMTEKAIVDEIEPKIVAMTDLLDCAKSTSTIGGTTVSKDGKAQWERNTEDYDLAFVMNKPGVPAYAKLILLGCAWNYTMLEQDRSEGVHNYAFVKATADNTYNTLVTLKQKGVADGWWNW